MTVTVHASWKAGKDFPRPRMSKLKALIRQIVSLAVPDAHTVTVTFLDPRKMARVNWDFLGHQGSTDVISFDYRTPDMPMVDCDPDEPEVEIFVCPAVALRESRKRSLPYSREVTLYVAHGFLHAGGYDDLQPKLKRRMRAAEKRVLSALPSKIDTIFPEPSAEVV